MFPTHEELMWHKADAIMACGICQSWAWQISWKQGKLRDNETLNLSRKIGEEGREHRLRELQGWANIKKLFPGKSARQASTWHDAKTPGE